MHTTPVEPEPPRQSSRPVPTFGDAIATIPEWTDMSEMRRRELASALHSAARMLALPPAAIPCDPAWLNERLFRRSPAAFGIGAGRYRNILSGLRAVLRRLGSHDADRRKVSDLPDEWRALIEVVPHAGQRGALAAFARFCATAGIGPAAAGDNTLAAFVEAERGARLSAGLDGRARKVAAAWNACVRAGLPGWPSRELAAARQREPYALPLSAYPESFAREVAELEGRLGAAGGRFLMAGGGHRRMRPASIKARIFAIRQAAGLLVRSGIPPAEIRGLRDVVWPIERVMVVLDTLAEAQAARTGQEQPEGGQLAMVAETLRQVAAHHVALPQDAVATIAGWAKQARGRRRAEGMTRKNRERLRALVPLERRALLLHLPAELMRRARLLGAGSIEAGRLARTAAALEILLVCPLRRRSLLALRIDEHLQRLDPRRRHITHLVLQPDDMKNQTPFEWPLPRASADLLDSYIRDFRPALAASDNPWLLASGAGVLSENRLSESLEAAIAKEVGADVNVHLLRHFAAWLHLKAHPGAYEDVRRVLGHKSLETTIAYYIAFEAAMSAERFDAAVLAERRATQAVAAARWASLKGKPRRGVA